MPSPLCHFEIMTADPERAKEFYGKVFGWEFDDQSMPGYTLISTGAEPTGGMFKKPDEASGVCLNAYFLVANVAQSLQKAIELGAKPLVEPTSIPNVGEFAIIADPDGIAVGLFKPVE